MWNGNNFRKLFFFILVLVLLHCSPKGEDKQRISSIGNSKYEDLVTLFKEWREFQKPSVKDGVPDYTVAAMKEQKVGLNEFQSRLNAINPSSWPISHQVDYHIVRAEMNGLDFDHRVLRPWSRNPCFYVALYPSPTDVPAREGPERYATLRLWEYEFPLSDKDLFEFQKKLQAIPKILEQAKNNLTEEAKDLWFLGIRMKKNESIVLGKLVKRLAEFHPELARDAEQAKTAVDSFRKWLEEKYEDMTAPSGIGIKNFNWYMKNVHLVPYTWEDQLTIIQRELDRSLAHMMLTKRSNRRLPILKPVESKEEYQRRFNEAVDYFMEFLREEEIMTVPDYLNDTLRRKNIGFIASGKSRDFFTQVEYRDSFPMRCHGTHWFDLARMQNEPHSSPIRQVPLLYNIWDSRAEGLATGMEEMMMHAGYLDERPRVKELVYILLANRAARAMGDLKMHSNEFTLKDAINFAVQWTPHGWLLEEGNTVWFDEQLYLNQPGYGTSYVVGKVHIEKLIADRFNQLGEKFSFKQFMDDFHAAGMIPLSLIRWEMTGLNDEIKKLW